jgi:hypothetical protein
MFKWIMSLFTKKKVYTDLTIMNPPIGDDNYADIISKLCSDESVFTGKDILFLNTLSREQLVYLILILKQ